MAYLNTSELELQESFTCHEALPPEPFDPIWDGSIHPILNPYPSHLYWQQKTLQCD